MKTRKISRTEPRQNSPADRARIAEVPRNNRSAIANGALGVDQRTKTGRRWRDLFLHYMGETGGKREQECRSLSSLVLTRESLDAALARGEPVDPMDLVRVCGAISRALVRLGLVDADEPDEPLPADAPAWAIGRRAEAAAS